MTIRAPLDEDLRFVRSAWLESYSTSDYARFATPPPYWTEHGHGGRVYYTGQRALIERILASSVVLVAEGEGGLLDGFAVGWPSAMLHYVYVKQSARHRGIARALCSALDLHPGQAIVYTHRSAGVRGNPRGWTFDPSPTTLLKETEMDTSKMHRVKYVQMNEHVRLRGGPTASIELRSFLRAEEDMGARAFFDERTAVVYVLQKDLVGDDTIVAVPPSSCRQVVLYPPGGVPKWETEAKATALPPKAKGAAA